MAYNRAKDDYRKSIRPDKPSPAFLGGFVTGSFQFIVATNPALAYVRYLDGFQTTAKHRNRVDLTLDPTDADNQDIPIALYYDEYGDLAIWGGDPNQFGAILQQNPNAGAGGVKRVVAGANIIVDNSDPTRPIVIGSNGGNKDLYFESDPQTIFNSTTPTSMYSGVGVGSRELPADWWATSGRVVEIEFGGAFSVGASPSTITYDLGFVGQPPVVSIAFTCPATGAGMYKLKGRIACFSSGASGIFEGDVQLVVFESVVANATTTQINLGNGSPIDTTGLLTLDAVVTMSFADSSTGLDASIMPNTIKYFDPN